MNLKKYSIIFVAVIVLVVGAFSYAKAWPDMPPTKAFISGPGIRGQVAITDPTVLATLRLGNLEDLNTGAIQKPAVASEGYDITRYFDGNFNFAELTYYPGTNGAKSYVYWQDGAQLSGDHTPFNNQWLNVTAQGDAVMQKFLQRTLADAASPLLVRVGNSTASYVAYDAASLKPRFVLPKGLRSADGQHYYAAFNAMGATVIDAFDSNTGMIASSFALDGDWSLSRVSATGAWLALTKNVSDEDKAAWTQANTWKTNIAIVDATSGKTTRNVALDGNFEVDALNAEGRYLYLIEHLPAVNPTHYQVRSYDISRGQLQEGVIVDKREIDEVMVGYPWDAVATPDGTWLMTLYLKSNENGAFIHALNLHDGYAWCIDLPSGANAEQLKNYSLALSPDASMVYAVNSALGNVSLIRVGDADVLRTYQYAVATTSIQTNDATYPMSHALAATDGKQVYFTDGHGVWSFDVGTGRVEQLLKQDKSLVGFVQDMNGQVYLANADQTLSALSGNASALVGR